MCFAVNAVDGDRAQDILRNKFASAIRTGRIQDVGVEKDCAVLAAVGQRMAANKGVAAKFFTALATAGVNIKAMAQGSSEYNITVLVKQVLHLPLPPGSTLLAHADCETKSHAADARDGACRRTSPNRFEPSTLGSSSQRQRSTSRLWDRAWWGENCWTR